MQERQYAFNDYMNRVRTEKGMKWKEVAEHIGLNPKSVYKLVSLEKPTRQRDKLLVICLGMHMTLEEVQMALALYGFGVLYVRNRRDAILMKCFMDGVYSVVEVDCLLVQNGEKSLHYKAEIKGQGK